MAKIKVLILEDNISDAKLIVRQLRKSVHEFKWITVKDRAGFLSNLNSFHADLILSDYSLPQFNGLEALEIARQTCPEIPFIMVTGSLNEEMAVECMRRGAWDYVLKEHLVYLNHAIDNCLKLKHQNLERDRALQALRDNEKRLSNLMANLPGMVYRCQNDESWTMYYLSQGCFALTGYQINDLLQNNEISYNKIIHPEDRPLVNEEVSNSLNNNEKFQLEYRITTKDGDVKWVWEQGSAILSENNEILYLEGFVTDITQRKLIMDDLQQSQQKLRLMVDKSPMGFSATDLNGFFIDANNAFCSMLGRTREEILGRHFNEFSHPDYHQMNLDLNKKIFQGKIDSFVVKKKYIRKDGQNVLVSLRTQMVKDEAGIPLFQIAQSEDITEKTKTELKVKKSEEQFRTFAENLPGFVWIYDIYPNGDYQNIFIGPGVEEIIPHELISIINEDPVRINDFIPKEDLKKIEELSDFSLKHGTNFDAQYRLKFNPEEFFWVRARFAVQIIENNIQRWQGVLFDISEQKKTQQALLESEERFILFMDHLPASVFIKDLDHKYIYANNYLKENFLGDNWVDKEPEELFNKSIAEKILKMEKQAIKNGEAIFEQTIKDRKGVLRTLKTHLFIIGKDRSLLGGFSSDITEELNAKEAVIKSKEELEKQVEIRTSELLESSKELEESQTALTYLLEDVNTSREELLDLNRRLEFSNKELEAFAHSVSHDLRAPLRHINGFIELLYEHLADTLDSVAREYFGNIKDSSKNMGLLIEQLLVFSRMGRISLNKIRIDHNEIVEEALKILKNDILDRNITFDIQPLGNVFADPLLLRQVWVNLISNAVKYTRNVDQAIISIGKENKIIKKETFTWYFIQDNGVGFDNKFADKAFQVFQRLHSDSEYQGIGVGLANVSRIIQRHGGRISAEAEVNKGARFFFYLPEE